jgi:hypothetical protein
MFNTIFALNSLISRSLLQDPSFCRSIRLNPLHLLFLWSSWQTPLLEMSAIVRLRMYNHFSYAIPHCIATWKAKIADNQRCDIVHWKTVSSYEKTDAWIDRKRRDETESSRRGRTASLELYWGRTASLELYCNSSLWHTFYCICQLLADDNIIRSFKYKQDCQLSHHIRRIYRYVLLRQA